MKRKPGEAGFLLLLMKNERARGWNFIFLIFLYLLQLFFPCLFLFLLTRPRHLALLLLFHLSPSCSFHFNHPICTYFCIRFLSSLLLCSPNVFYVVIKQCQTEKLFINTIKRIMSSNGCLCAFLLLMKACTSVYLLVFNRHTSNWALRLNDKATKRKKNGPKVKK